MDYTKARWLFKVRKAVRYASLYGVRRTVAKIQGQYHMQRRYPTLPPTSSAGAPSGHVGLLGCGNFAFSNIAYYLHRNYGRVMRGAMDVNIERAASLYEAYGLSYYTQDAARVIDDPSIDLIYIASNHASHAEYAIAALSQGKSVHIEKPHVVSLDQLTRLCAAMQSASEARVSLGFNRPDSRFGRIIKRYLDGQSGPSMINWFIAGHEIAPEHWYFKKEEGGRVLGNLCHWTDFVYRMVPAEARYPITIRPTRASAPDSDIAVTYTFGDGSIAALTFSAKGHTFEGVRERFAAHRGNVLISMDDFRTLRVDVVDRKKTWLALFRDHGHEGAIQRSYELVDGGSARAAGCSVDYVWETGELFLRTREALEHNREVIVEAYSPNRIAVGRTPEAVPPTARPR